MPAAAAGTDGATAATVLYQRARASTHASPDGHCDRDVFSLSPSLPPLSFSPSPSPCVCTCLHVCVYACWCILLKLRKIVEYESIGRARACPTFSSSSLSTLPSVIGSGTPTILFIGAEPIPLHFRYIHPPETWRRRCRGKNLQFLHTKFDYIHTIYTIYFRVLDTVALKEHKTQPYSHASRTRPCHFLPFFL